MRLTTRRVAVAMRAAAIPIIASNSMGLRPRIVGVGDAGAGGEVMVSDWFEMWLEDPLLSVTVMVIVKDPARL